MLSTEDRLTGVLLGTALGDALGLPAEGMKARTVARRFGTLDRFRLLGSTGFVSDDTEQAALVAQSLARCPDDPAACAREFRRSLLGWFLRLPWGVGAATVRACLRIAAGQRVSGVRSAGNGAAMRAAVLGVYFHDAADRRQAFGRALAEVTHTDPRAVEGALYVAELAAACVATPDQPRPELVRQSREVVTHPDLVKAMDAALSLESEGTPLEAAAEQLGTSGFIPHTLGWSTFCFLRCGDAVLPALTATIAGGGDTDSSASIVGSWLGALHGPAALPGPLIQRIQDGPFGPTHLRALAHCLACRREGRPCPVPGYSAPAALARNLALYPVILGHGFRRLVPW